MTRDQIRGILFGTAIGDVLGGGKPETFSDTTTLAVMMADRLADSRSLREFLKMNQVNRPTNTGEASNNVTRVAAILAPFCLSERAAPWSRNLERLWLPYDILDPLGAVIRFAFLSYVSPTAAAACAAMVGATIYCLERESMEFSFTDFRSYASELAYHAFRLSSLLLEDRGIEVHETDPHFLSNRILQAGKVAPVSLGEEFGGGNSWAVNSLPFSLAHFVAGPFRIQTLHRVVSAGGDVRRNGAQVGALLGALNGMSVFPNTLVQRLTMREEIEHVATKVCDALNLPNGGAQ